MHLAAINNRAEVILLLLSADGGEDLVNTNDQVMMNNLFDLTTEFNFNLSCKLNTSTATNQVL